MAKAKEQKLAPAETVETPKVEEPSKPKKQIKEQPTSSGYVHIDVFLDTAQVIFNLHPYQVAGFKAFMTGQHYQNKDTDFIPFLEKYLGKEVK